MDNYESKQVEEAIQIIKQLELTDFVKDFNEDSGFMWSQDKRITEIGNRLSFQNHSGASFALLLRCVQTKLKLE
tara:strand:- start:191 stop:412 length:222 start_codon:yes stop_codon:yes gene_type:complete